MWWSIPSVAIPFQAVHTASVTLEGGRKGGKEGEREGEREGGREGWRKGGWEEGRGGRERN